MNREDRLRRWIELIALSSFAVAQPILSLVGENATFLVAQGLSGSALVLYSLAVLAVPALVAIAVDELLVVSLQDKYQPYGIAWRAVLLALVVAPPLNEALGLPGSVSLFTFLILMVVGWFALRSSGAALTVVRYAGIAPLVFLGWFIFASPASALLVPADGDIEMHQGGDDTSVVWLIFDQFPLPLLLEPDGSMSSERFPNFSRLAEQSTWFPRATTVATATRVAIPSALTGRYAEFGTLPVVSANPQNLFTILGSSHQIEAIQSVTQLCPDSLCRAEESAAPVPDTGLIRDSLIIAVRVLLADDLADSLVPEIDDRWTGFGSDRTTELDLTVLGEASEAEDLRENRVNGVDDRSRVEEFVEQVGSSTQPTVHYLHIEKPHEPIVLLPDGRAYDYCFCFRKDETFAWPKEPEMAQQRTQRYLLQAQYVDNVLGRVLDAMELSGIGDRSILVVMSDHGAALQPGQITRGAGTGNIHDVLPVPLFIRQPGQSEGRIDERRVQTIDILPTVLDQLGVDLAAQNLDGQSLLGSAPGRPPMIVTSGGPTAPAINPDPFASTLPDWVDDLFPDPSNPFSWGENANLYGERAADLNAGDSELTASLRNLSHLQTVEDEEGFVPAHLIGELHGTDQSVELAVAVNGRVAGTGATFRTDYWVISLMIDPQALRIGANTIELFEIDGERLRLIAES